MTENFCSRGCDEVQDAQIQLEEIVDLRLNVIEVG